MNTKKTFFYAILLIFFCNIQLFSKNIFKIENIFQRNEISDDFSIKLADFLPNFAPINSNFYQIKNPFLQLFDNFSTNNDKKTYCNGIFSRTINNFHEYSNNFSQNSDTISHINDNFSEFSENFMPISQFTYAGSNRYILVGGTPRIRSQIQPIPLTIFAGTLASLFVLQHQMQMKTIWKVHSPFKFQEDAAEEIGIDKIGHFYGVYAASYFLREGFVAAGLSWNAANNWSAAVGTLYSTYVEILDGYGEQWGFSPSDFAADLAGGLFFAAQNYFPILQNITPKFHYIPANWFGYSRRNPHEMFIDDYSSQAFFFSLNIHNFLPKNLQQYYPDWLELSIGYVVRDGLVLGRDNDGVEPCAECISLQAGAWGSPRLVLALDYNMSKLLPDFDNNLWNWFKQSLNLVKFPSPALEIGKVTRFYLLFPFKIF